MSGPIEVGQRWASVHRNETVRVTEVSGDTVVFDGDCLGVSSVVGFLRHYRHKPTIPLRIRVGVTADGTWVAFGMERRAAEGWEIDALVDERLHEVVPALKRNTQGNDSGMVVGRHECAPPMPLSGHSRNEWERVGTTRVRAPVVAWHWITAEVPMPETEQGETRGEVEP